MADIGTPENPEIIEPGQDPAPRTSPLLPKWAIARQILRVLVAVTLPALGLDFIFGLFFHSAMNGGGALPWLGLLLLIIPAFLLTLVAAAAHFVLWPALFLILSGRATSHPLSHPRFMRFSLRKAMNPRD